MNEENRKSGAGPEALPDFTRAAEDYRRIEKAIILLEGKFLKQPSLAEIAAELGSSEFHFQRLFSRWAGISPKRFLQFLTKEYAKKLLEDSDNLLDAAFDSGLSGPSRLHDLFVTCEAVTPGEYRRRGEGLLITYGFHPSPFGRCMIAVTDRGICGLGFIRDDRGEAELAAGLARGWPAARLRRGQEETAVYARRIFSPPGRAETNPADGREGSARESPPPGPLHLLVRGTNFQIQVWQALLRIPPGRAVTYENLAVHLGMPRAARAVGNAVGDNPVPFLIPCHRVLRKAGDFGNYGEGPARKKAILGWEAARREIAAGQT